MNFYPRDKTALIIVDPFNDFLSEGGRLWPFVKETVEGMGVVENLAALLKSARSHSVQVVYAPHHHFEEHSFRNWQFMAPSHEGVKNLSAFKKGSWGASFHPDLIAQDGDLIAQNHWTASGFANTDLDFLLKLHGLEYIVIAGMRANTCIDCTARYGVELGYHVTLIKDAIGAFNYDEIHATVVTNFPNYGHRLLTTEEFIADIKS